MTRLALAFAAAAALGVAATFAAAPAQAAMPVAKGPAEAARADVVPAHYYGYRRHYRPYWHYYHRPYGRYGYYSHRGCWWRYGQLYCRW
jgi:hypothetical protein